MWKVARARALSNTCVCWVVKLKVEVQWFGKMSSSKSKYVWTTQDDPQAETTNVQEPTWMVRYTLVPDDEYSPWKAVFFKAGNKEYNLNGSLEYGELVPETALKKKYK